MSRVSASLVSDETKVAFDRVRDLLIKFLVYANKMAGDLNISLKSLEAHSGRLARIEALLKEADTKI